MFNLFVSRKRFDSIIKELDEVSGKVVKYEAEYAGAIDLEKIIIKKKEDLSEITDKIVAINNKYKEALELFTRLEKEINIYNDSLDIGSQGLYKRQFPFETSEAYKDKIEINFSKQREIIKSDNAVTCNTEWTVHGSKAEGRKMTNQFKKLLLFAFNGECDAIISKVKWNTVNKAKERISKSFDNINKLGVTQNTYITNFFLNLKLEELALTYEYELKKYEEKEEQRQIREQMREEEKAQKEFERAQKEAEDEELRFQKALTKAKNELEASKLTDNSILLEKISLLENQLKNAQYKKEKAIALAQQTKVGHIYVISNVGSFGEDVYKIGMTRRLDPTDRVKELGDASVPFHFDIHAIIYSDNAPQLENELHKKFSDRRLNRVNNKKEFLESRSTSLRYSLTNMLELRLSLQNYQKQESTEKLCQYFKV